MNLNQKLKTLTKFKLNDRRGKKEEWEGKREKLFHFYLFSS